MMEYNLIEKLKQRAEEEKMIDIALSGTSATLVIQMEKKLYIAWVGDSKVVLGKKEKTQKV